MNEPDNKTGAGDLSRPYDVGCELLATLGLLSQAAALLTRGCQWSEDPDGNWDTACGRAFVFNDGGPSDNGAKWCPFCGGELTEVRCHGRAT